MNKQKALKQERKIGIKIAFVLMVILIGVYFWDFGVRLQQVERNRGIENLSDLAVQGATIMENKIESATSLLWGMSRTLEQKPDLQSDEVMEYLEKVVNDHKTDIVKIGIADRSGKARTTMEKGLDVSERVFFKETVKGKEYISPVVSQTEENNRIAAAVPIYDEQENVKAVLYGVIQTEDLQLYKNTALDMNESDQYVHIIDDQGNYVVRSQNKNRMTKDDNFFRALDTVKSTMPVEDVQKSLEARETVLTKVSRKNDIRYVYIAPMNVNNWCVVTVLTGKKMEKQISYSKTSVIFLIMKTFLTIMAFGIFCYVTFNKEKKQIERLNEELGIKDKVFRIATSDIGNFVFVYNCNTRTLEFMNYNKDKLPLPPVIREFPTEFPKYMPEGSKPYKEVKRLIALVGHRVKEPVGEMSVSCNGVVTNYRVQLVLVVNDRDDVVQVVGTLKDITGETQKDLRIKKGEQLRSAVLSDTIGFFEVDLNRDALMRDGEVKNLPYSYSECVEKFVELKVSEEYQDRVKNTYSVKNLLHMYELGIYDVPLEYLRKDKEGKEFWVHCEAHLQKDIVTGNVLALAVVRNINEKKEREIQLKEQAKLDPLTKAYNRSTAREKINELLKEHGNTNNAFLLLDLDNFKGINDTLGHLVGDTVLIDVVKTLKHHVRSEDVVCRLGGDEFVVFLVDMPIDVIDRNITNLLKKLNVTYGRDGVTETCSASIGVAIAPKHGSDFQSLYEKADVALYEVKKNCKNNYRIYKEE